MRRNFFMISLALLSLSAALLGCGGGDGATDPDPTPTPTPTPTPGGESGRIVYQGPDGLFLMNADGTGKVRVTTTVSPDDDLDPDFSPDGSRVTFVRKTSTTYQLMVVNIDGSNLRQLTSRSRYLRFPHWSPDSSRIIYGASVGSGEGIYTILPDATNETRLEEAGDGSLPSWSPDGTRIVFCSDRGGTGMDIYRINTDGTGLTRITNTPDYKEWSPAWSPDGTKLTCYAEYTSSTEKQIAVMNADGTGRIVVGPENARYPSWSPTGAKIIFSAPKAVGSTINNLYTMNPDGTNIVNLTNSTASEFDPSWEQ